MVLFPKAPCAPTQLRVESSCESNNISVSWQGSQGSVSYTAVAENADGLRWSCNTSSTNCQITALPCGQQYQVYVAGFDETCIGAKSNIEVIRTGRSKVFTALALRGWFLWPLSLLSPAPCVPQGIQHSLDCLNGVLNVTWQSTGYFVQFHTSIVSSTGDISSCKTDKHHCTVDSMQCGWTYNIKVLAEDEACNSSYSPTQQISAGMFISDLLLQTFILYLILQSWTYLLQLRALWRTSPPPLTATPVLYLYPGMKVQQRSCTWSQQLMPWGTNTTAAAQQVAVTSTRFHVGRSTMSPSHQQGTGVWAETVPQKWSQQARKSGQMIYKWFI